MLVQGVASDELALGFMPFAYYEENKAALKLVPVDDGKADNGDGPIAPSVETDAGRHLSAAVAAAVHLRVDEGADRPEVQQFVDFYLAKGARRWSEEVGYVPLGDARLPAGRRALHKARTHRLGVRHGGSQVGVTIEQLLARETR